MRLNHKPESLRVGDRVTTDYNLGGESIVRTVLRIDVDTECESGRRVWLSGAAPCPSCRQVVRGGEPVSGVDSAWAIPCDGGAS